MEKQADLGGIRIYQFRIGLRPFLIEFVVGVESPTGALGFTSWIAKKSGILEYSGKC